MKGEGRAHTVPAGLSRSEELVAGTERCWEGGGLFGACGQCPGIGANF